MAAQMAQYVTIIDKSNKVIGNSRQFKDVFMEAKSAYTQRKAELKAKKKIKEEEELQRAIRAVTIQDESERASTIRPDGPRRQSTNRTHIPGNRSPPTHDRPRTERMQSNTSARTGSGHTTPRDGAARGFSLGDFNNQVYGQYPIPPNPWEQPDTHPRPSNGLVRVRTDQPMQLQRRPSQMPRSQSVDDIDMDLAYGDYHPESIALTTEDQRKKELNGLVARCKGLLDEADCAGHSAKAIIEHLQRNPDALAAVGLTLAEISSVAGKMAPGALAAIAKSAPAVMALLLSPQFLIAVGVAAGVTVIAIGGFKIIKKMKERPTGAGDEQFGRHVGPGVAEAIDVRELDRVETWRRGVPESVADDNRSVVSGTTVEGEFITPFAAQSMGQLPRGSVVGSSRSKGTRKSGHGKGKEGEKERERDVDGNKKKKHRRRRSQGEEGSAVSVSEAGDGSVGSKESRGTVKRSQTEKSLVKVKKPSPLSRMFTTGSVRS